MEPHHLIALHKAAKERQKLADAEITFEVVLREEG